MYWCARMHACMHADVPVPVYVTVCAYTQAAFLLSLPGLLPLSPVFSTYHMYNSNPTRMHQPLLNVGVGWGDWHGARVPLSHDHFSMA